MPYRQIHWMKLEKRLLNDPRFYLMREESQLIYVKLLLAASHFDNKITRNMRVLKSVLRCNQSEADLQKYIEEIQANFPKFLANKHFYSFKGFKQRHNQVIPRDSEDYFKNSLEKNKKEEVDKIKDIYIMVKGYRPQDLSNYSFVGYQVKQLLRLCAKDFNLITEGMKWVSNRAAMKGFEDWRLSTVIKWWPDFMKARRGKKTKELVTPPEEERFQTKPPKDWKEL